MSAVMTVVPKTCAWDSCQPERKGTRMSWGHQQAGRLSILERGHRRPASVQRAEAPRRKHWPSGWPSRRPRSVSLSHGRSPELGRGQTPFLLLSLCNTTLESCPKHLVSSVPSQRYLLCKAPHSISASGPHGRGSPWHRPRWSCFLHPERGGPHRTTSSQASPEPRIDCTKPQAQGQGHD